VGDIALSSSRGPTADGRQKPDLSAPGTMITSTLSHDAPVCSSELQTNCIDPTLVTPDGRNFTETGTSMSAPHVTGTVALMLQVNPVLDQRAVTAILRSTARHDQFTGSAAWSPAFGAGKLDALAAVQNVLGSPLTPPIDPVVSPTASVPVPASPVAFRLVGVRAETSNGGPIQRTSVGRPVNLAIYAHFSRLPDNARLLVEWKVTQGSAVVGYNTLRRVLNHTETGTSRWVWRFVPRRAGKYVFVAHVTTEGISKAGSVVLTVR